MLLARDLGRTDRQTETKMDGWTAHYKSPAERGPNKQTVQNSIQDNKVEQKINEIAMVNS